MSLDLTRSTFMQTVQYHVRAAGDMVLPL